MYVLFSVFICKYVRTTYACIIKDVWLISDFPRQVSENCGLLGYDTGSIGSLLRTFRDNLSVQSSGFEDS